MIKGLLIDLDGVIYNDSNPIPGSAETIRWLQAKQIPFRFITNTTMKSRATLQQKLNGLGIQVVQENIFSAAFATAAYLRKKTKNSCHCFFSGDALSEFDGLRSDSDKVDFVVAGDPGNGVTFEKLNRAFLCLMNGAQLLAMQKNRFWLSDQGYVLDAGAFVALLEYAAKTEALLMGKPSKTFFNLAADSLNLKAPELLMIGDDLESDIVGAAKIGIKTCLVKTGKFLPKDLEQAKVTADWILNSIADLPRAGIV